MSRFFERRSFQRVPTDFSATISGPGGSFEARVIDLSLGGIELDATHIEPKSAADESFRAAVLFDGAMTSVEFELPDNMGHVHAFAHVRWRSDDPRMFGAEFVDPEPDARRLLNDYVEQRVHTMSTLDNPTVE